MKRKTVSYSLKFGIAEYPRQAVITEEYIKSQLKQKHVVSDNGPQLTSVTIDTSDPQGVTANIVLVFEDATFDLTVITEDFVRNVLEKQKILYETGPILLNLKIEESNNEHAEQGS